MSWCVDKLGDLAETHLGKRLHRAGNKGEYYPYLGNDNIQWGELKLDEIKEIRLTSDELERYRVRPGDLLVCEGGDPGRCAIWDQDDEMYFQMALHRVRPDEKRLDAYWLKYYLMSLKITGALDQFITARTTIKHIPQPALRAIPIRHPDIASQRRIASILMAYDNFIENNRRQIALLEEAADLIYGDWLSGHDESSFEKGVISDYFDVTIGKTPPRSQVECFVGEGVPWASVKDLGNTVGAYISSTSECLTEEAIENYNVKVKPAGTILLSFKLTIGRIAIAERPTATNEAIAHFVTENDAMRLYTYEYLKSFDYDALGSTSSIGKAINSKIVRSIPFNIPDEESLERLYSQLNPVFRLMHYCQQRAALLVDARDRLLPKLMSGEIEV